MDNNDLLKVNGETGDVFNESNSIQEDNVQADKDKFMWKPFLRQLLVCSSIWVSYFMCGLNMGAPTVFIPQIRKERNSTYFIDQEMATWLSSIIPYSGMLCAFILPLLIQLSGRRLTVLVLATTSFIGYIILIYSTSVRDLLISQGMYGLLIASCNTILPIIITEYTSPRYRGILLTLKTASYYWGIWVSNFIGTFYYWKFIAYFGISCNAYVLVTLIFWLESPYWLVSKGRYNETIESHRFLKGCSVNAEKELQKLLASDLHTITNKSNKSIDCINIVNNFTSTISNKELYKPTLLSLLMITLCNTSGKAACTIYAIDIIKTITQSESTAYKGMLLLDGVTVFGMYMGCIAARFFKRRTLMISCSCIAVVFLLFIYLYLYFIKLGFIVQSSLFLLSLMTVYQLSISVGPMILSTSIYGELAPMKFIGYNVFAMAFYSFFLSGCFIKFSPWMYTKFGLHNAFLFYGTSTGICTYFVYKYLPETKDKTLQEIRAYFNQSNTS